MKKSNILLTVIAPGGLLILGIVLFANFANWRGLNISVNPQTVANILAPLILTAAFIERAVEVFITPWRDPGANQLQAKLDSLKADATATQQQKDDATAALNSYVADTTRYALALASMFGLVAAMIGVRALWPFLDSQAMTVFTAPLNGQQRAFVVYDVVLSAALMAGGANGIHAMVTNITMFFDANTQKLQNSIQQSAQNPQVPGNQ
jgi:hypothetical protein